MPSVLALDKVSYAVPGGARILSEVSFALAAGAGAWISGPSGGGKSTLLRIMNRLLSPTGGTVLFQGRPAGEYSFSSLRRRVALLQQTPVMLPGTVADNLRLPFTLKAAGDSGQPGGERLASLVQDLGLSAKVLEQPAGELSVGQKQRVALGRLLLMEPAALLLDEPVAALDEESRDLVERAAADFVKAGGAVVLVSHLEPAHGGFGACRLKDGVLRGPT